MVVMILIMMDVKMMMIILQVMMAVIMMAMELHKIHHRVINGYDDKNHGGDKSVAVVLD